MPKQARTQSESSSLPKKTKDLFILNKGDNVHLATTKDNEALFLMAGPNAGLWDGFICLPDALDELRQLRFNINVYLRKFKKKGAKRGNSGKNKVRPVRIRGKSRK